MIRRFICAGDLGKRIHRGISRRRKRDSDWGTEAIRNGNPGGRPRTAHNIQELARKHTIEALDVLVQIMLNEKAPPNARVAAANTLLDRAYGKAPTFSTSDTQAFKRAIDMTDDELAAIVAKARLTVIK